MRFLVALALSVALQAQSNFDEALAKKLHADEMGMRKYVMAFLKAGPTPPKDRAESQKVMGGHMANINRMAKEGKLAIAGPFLDRGELRGIYIFNVESVAEAEALTKTDPAIQSGALVMELHPWYGSAALQEVNGIHEKIAKKNP
ncbi:hypothetical protein F183_A15110 [Bryobacterales bacterium F-183]|nr:hypothetical protein F183_A15110 [Bryobacterales bacterium F-183]